MSQADESWIDIPQVQRVQHEIGENVPMIEDIITRLEETVEKIEAFKGNFATQEARDHINKAKDYLGAAKGRTNGVATIDMATTASAYNDIIEIERVDKYKDQLNEAIRKINSQNRGKGIIVGYEDWHGNNAVKKNIYRTTSCEEFTGGRPYTFEGLYQSEQYLELKGNPFNVTINYETRPSYSKK